MSEFKDLIDEATASKASVDEAYEEAKAEFAEITAAFEGYHGITAKSIDVAKIKDLLKDNWKTISVVAGAAGIPIGVADPSAFSGILDVLGNVWPF